MVGVISKQRIVEALRWGGNGYVQSAMVRAFDIAQRSDSLASAFRKLGATGLNMIPVVDQQRLVGIVTMQNLMHSMALLAETRRYGDSRKQLGYRAQVKARVILVGAAPPGHACWSAARTVRFR